mmetsp:Transcript_84638/g.274188  ORF Transcript_84638/g.274188 Transcript_84638/m.274188 type:complete len:311 (-) Transcript_84638:50-982(-)
MPSSSSSDAASSSGSSSAPGVGEKGARKRPASPHNEDQVSVDSDGDSSSASESSGSEADKLNRKAKDKKAKKAKKKQKKQSKKPSKKKSKKKEKKNKKKESGKKSKKSKKAKKLKKANRDAVSNQFGKYGIIKAEDFFNKKPEFLLWALEVKKENTDAMGQMQMKDLFKEYIEDYNTATMPSKKYYNLQVWDQLQTSKRSKKIRGDDMSDAQKAALASFDDERARREEIKHLQAKKQEMQITDEVRRMRQDKTKVEEMKHQDRLRTQMDILNKSGHAREAGKIAERLDPGKDELGRPITPFTLARQKMNL